MSVEGSSSNCAVCVITKSSTEIEKPKPNICTECAKKGWIASLGDDFSWYAYNIITKKIKTY